jgi:hypothetical protein
MSRVGRLSIRKLSDRKLRGSFVYSGVVDAAGYRGHGLYIDGINETGNSVTCINTTGNSCDCCGDDGPPYYSCLSCNYNYITWSSSIPSASFSNSATQGWQDSNRSGFKSIAIAGYNYPYNNTTYPCTNCGTPTSQSFANANGNFGLCTYAGIKEWDNTLWTWGSNENGEAAQNNLLRSSSPVQVGSDTWQMVSAGPYHMAGIKRDGTLWSWGYNFYGDLGDNSSISRSSPVQVSGGGSWTFVYCRHYGTCAIKVDGTLWCWGYNNTGAVGDSTTTNRSSPVQVSGGGSWKFVCGAGDAANTHCIGIKTDGKMYGWGYNVFGQLGDGTNVAKSSPVLVVGGYTDWTHAKAILYGTLAVRETGSAWVWGYRTKVYNSTSTSSPTQIGTNLDHVSCSIGSSNTSDQYIGNNIGYHFITTGGNVTRYYENLNANRSSAYSGGGAVALVQQTHTNNIAGSAGYLVKYLN